MGRRFYSKCRGIWGGKHHRLDWMGAVRDREGPTAHLKTECSQEVEEPQAGENRGERKAFSPELIMD